MISLVTLLVAIAGLATLVVGLRLRETTDLRTEATIFIGTPILLTGMALGGIGMLEAAPGETAIGIGPWIFAFGSPIVLLLMLLVELTAIKLIIRRIDRSRMILIAVVWPVAIAALALAAWT